MDKKKAVILPVKSGRLVIANDLRSLTGHVKNHSVNNEVGEYMMSLEYMRYGMGFIFVGNTDPYVVSGENGIEIMTDPGERDVLGQIETSLWWVCMMDEETFLRRCKENNEDPSSFDPVVVNIEPSLYIVVSDKGEEVHISMKNIGPMPQLDTLFREPDFSPATHFGESRIWEEIRSFESSGFSGVEDIFTVLGNGYHWHKGQISDLNGHDKDVPFMKVPPADCDISDLVKNIPELPNFTPGVRGTKMSYPVNRTYPKLGAAPLNADPNDLAIGMMFIRTFLDKDINLIGSNVTPEEIRANQEILKGELFIAGQIAEKRGLFKDGTMDRIFSEILEVWPEISPPENDQEEPSP